MEKGEEWPSDLSMDDKGGGTKIVKLVKVTSNREKVKIRLQCWKDGRDERNHLKNELWQERRTWYMALENVNFDVGLFLKPDFAPLHLGSVNVGFYFYSENEGRAFDWRNREFSCGV